jgi:hypothetical protein
MADGGFSFPLDEPLSEEAEARLSKVITYRGERVDGGCDNWGMDYAFPGNFFAEDFQPLRMAALGRAEYVDILAAYENNETTRRAYTDIGIDARNPISNRSIAEQILAEIRDRG